MFPPSIEIENNSALTAELTTFSVVIYLLGINAALILSSVADSSRANNRPKVRKMELILGELDPALEKKHIYSTNQCLKMVGDFE